MCGAKFKEQHKEPAPPPTIINEEEEYEVEKYGSTGNEDGECSTQCTGKDMGMKHNQWIAEMGLPHAKQAVKRLLDKVFESKTYKEGG